LGVITDKLNAEWSEKVINEKQFAVRAEVEMLYNNVTDFLHRAGQSYPTGDATFDSYMVPIRNEVVKFKSLLDTYAEFINWRQPS
jgi:hypothetical protein